jgi:tetratricopeptide (TPR) repeat protein
MWRRLGHVTESLRDFGLSLQLKENQPEVYYLRGQTFFEVGDLERSVADLKHALELHPKYGEARDLLRHVMKKM